MGRGLDFCRDGGRDRGFKWSRISVIVWSRGLVWC